MMLSKRMTEKSRAETAAAAMVQRITSRSRPLVLRPVSPLKKKSPPGSELSAAIVGGGGGGAVRWTFSLCTSEGRAAMLSNARLEVQLSLGSRALKVRQRESSTRSRSPPSRRSSGPVLNNHMPL